VFIQWAGKPAADATWEDEDEFRRTYLTFQLEDELFAKEGRYVMVGITDSRKRCGKASKEAIVDVVPDEEQ
jgi:hypothetical protein